MSKILKLDLANYNREGVIPLRRGDDWSLKGQVLLRQSNVLTPVDLTGAAVTGFFEGDSSVVVADVTVTNETCGIVKISIPASGTSAVKLADNTSMYLTLDLSSELTTIEMESPDLEVKDRSFNQF